MKNQYVLSIVICTSHLALLTGCVSRSAEPAATPPGAASMPVDPIAELNRMDPRTPVPLQPMMAWHQKQNMQAHLVAIQGITDGLAKEDWAAVEAAAAELGLSPQMQQMCEHMGSGAKGFTEMGLDFHRRGDMIVEAAKARNVSAVLKATSATLQACTSCHAMFRQDVVDAQTWSLRTQKTHDPAMNHGSH